MDEFDSLTEGVFFVPPSTSTGKTKGKDGSKAQRAAKWDHFKLDGFQQLKDINEPLEAMEIRHTLFNQEWELTAGRIEDVMRNMNTVVLSAIYDFVYNAYSHQSNRASLPFQELPTGLIFAGINVPDHDLLFQQIAQTISSPTRPSPGTLRVEEMELHYDIPTTPSCDSLVVILQSKDCANLKSAQKAMIEQFLGLGIAGAINPLEGGAKLQNYDMLVLERWYRSLCEHYDSTGKVRNPPTLVIILQDFESFDYDTLQDFITICSNYQDRIPFVLLMGLATSIDALHQGLPKAVLSRLQTRKFQMQQSSECLTAIIEDLFIHANVGLMVGPLPLKQLIDQFIHYNFSIGGFISNLKYIVMHHFYANPLSILCDRSLTAHSKAFDLLTKGHFDHLRMLPSFQLYVEGKLETDPQEAEMLILDDEFLVQQIPDMVQGLQEYHQNFGMMFDFLWFLQSRFSISLLKKPKRALYFMALDGSLINSSHLPFLQSLVRKLDSNNMMMFVEDWLQLFKDTSLCIPKKSTALETAMDRELMVVQSIRDRMAALLDNVSEDSVTSSSELEDNGVETEVSSKVLNRGEPLATAFVKKRKLVSLNVYAHEAGSRQTKIAKKTRETARIPKGALGAYTLLVKEIDETISRFFRTYLVCHTSMPLNEIYYYSQVTIQQKAFLPQPRVSIQTALGQPEVYLNCDCCRPPADSADQSLADMVLPTQHDTCILYKLYVECGRMINMYDWFTAFGMILERGQQSDNVNEPLTKKRGGRGGKVKTTGASTNKLDQKEVQARFISGVAELQFMGFIKSTSRKTDHVMRLTWGNI